MGWSTKEWKNRRDCKRTCKSWFSANRSIREGCEKACKVDANIRYFPKEDYLCGELGPAEQDIISAFGIDYCPGSKFDHEDFIDPTGANKTVMNENVKDANFKRNMGMAVIGLVFLMIISIIIIKVK